MAMHCEPDVPGRIVFFYPENTMNKIVISALSAATCLAVIPAARAQDSLQPYIVVLKPDAADVPALAQALTKAHGGQLGFVYEHALRGFSLRLPPQAVAALANAPGVAYIEPDVEIALHAQTEPTGYLRTFADTHVPAPVAGQDGPAVDIDVAVIDTGVDWQHPDLNVVGGINCAQGLLVASCSGNGDDDHYHGTHVAGTIAARDNDVGVVGVAPGARVWAVKVLNSQGSGRTSWIVAGINWVAARAGTIKVANMSLGGSGHSQAQYDAIQGAVRKGVAFAVSAGNSDADADGYSPARFDNVLTVSALADFDGLPGGLGKSTCRADEDDTLANFSNWGPAVDVAAPGVCILSTFPIERGSYGTASGTSMAAPHVAGALALLASRNKPTSAADVEALYAIVRGIDNFDWTDESGDGIHEPLLDVSSPAFAPTFFTPAPEPEPEPDPEPDPEPPTIALTAKITKSKGNKSAALTWTGASAPKIDVWRGASLRATTENDGAHTDPIGKGGGTATYKVCEAGSDICSNAVTLQW